MKNSWKPSTKSLQSELVDGCAVLRLNRPEVLNALTRELLEDLAAGIRWHGRERRARGVVITGAGRAFSSGDDLKEAEGLEQESFIGLIGAFQDVTRAISETDVPVIAALNGIAVGGAAEITFACDIRVGCSKSEFMFPENTLGMLISNGSTINLPSLVGPRALPLVLLGERLGAERARELGLFDVFVDNPDAVTSEAVRIALSLTEEGRATSLHLSLLRVPPAEMEKALKREVEAAEEAWNRGLPQANIRQFLESRSGRAKSG